ncbi:hypothetical protein Tco_0797827 [Tanacetum coccineum]
MFHVSNLKKCYADEPLAVLLDGLHLDDKLHFVEEPLEIVGREVKRLKRSRIPLVKVRWNSKRGPEFTWEREDQFKKKYPHLFTKTASSSSAASVDNPEMGHKMHYSIIARRDVELSVYELSDYLREEELRLCLEEEERLRYELEKLIVEEKMFRLEEANRLRLEEENMLQLAKENNKKKKEFMNSINCHLIGGLKHYYGGDTPPFGYPGLQNFPKEQLNSGIGVELATFGEQKQPLH